MTSKTPKTEMLDTLRQMLREVFQLRNDGVAYARLARAHGYVDGYMRVLLETGIADKRELLELVARERMATGGPATGQVSADSVAA